MKFQGRHRGRSDHETNYPKEQVAPRVQDEGRIECTKNLVCAWDGEGLCGADGEEGEGRGGTRNFE
jgi:hypothetical protein